MHMHFRSWLGILFVGLLLLMAVPVTSNPPIQDPQGTAEALNPDANVRSEPSTAAGDATIVGQIQPGEVYPVFGRYFEWILLDFPPSPNGRAWVFSGVVRLSVPIDNLPTIDPASLPSIDSIQTATVAVQATTSAPLSTSVPSLPTLEPQQILPTFTPVAQTPTPMLLSDIDAQPSLADPDVERQRRLDVLTAIYDQSIVLQYADNVFLLEPATIGFAIDPSETSTLMDTTQPFSAATSRIVATYDPDLLRAFLDDIALRYDRGRQMIFDPTMRTFSPGQVGSSLDVDVAAGRIAAALFSPFSVARTVTLPTVPNQQPEMDDLRAAIVDYLAQMGVFYNSANSVISVYVRNLDTDASMGLQADVLHSATSTAKIGVIASYFRYVFQTPSRQMLYNMIAAVVCSSNGHANTLMQATGNGDNLAGIRNVTDTFCRGGASNTRLDRHFGIGRAGEGNVPPNYYTPAGAPVCQSQQPLDTSLTFRVDPEIQTTASDMGDFLASIYACAQDGGGLAQTFPGEITQLECQSMLEILSGTRFSHLMELGVPDTVDIAHKVGYARQEVGNAGVVGDAGIVYSAGATYVLTMYMWDSRLGNFDGYALGRWAVLGEISRIVYNFFNVDAPFMQPQSPLNPNGGAACVLPSGPEAVDINNVDAGRFNQNGIPLSSACYDWPNCRPFDNWGN